MKRRLLSEAPMVSRRAIVIDEAIAMSHQMIVRLCQVGMTSCVSLTDATRLSKGLCCSAELPALWNILCKVSNPTERISLRSAHLARMAPARPIECYGAPRQGLQYRRAREAAAAWPGAALTDRRRKTIAP